jgi:hypothetical protein
MAEIKVLNKPDYELTLSGDEKEALQKLLGRQSTQSKHAVGLDDREDTLTFNVLSALKCC